MAKTGSPTLFDRFGLQRFGVRSLGQVRRDLWRVLSNLPGGRRYGFNLASTALLRPDLSLPAYAGRVPRDGVAPIFNFFDRHAGGEDFRSTVRRSAGLCDWRGGRLSYDEHDGTDFVCPPRTPLVAAAPGIAVATRDSWLRGGLTLCLDHGEGVVTQYTHLDEVTVEMGQPVKRGEQVAWSGFSGFDMAQFFPWVPPHIHFMVWVMGRPVDPYRRAGESTTGAWLHGNEPETVRAPLDGDPSPDRIAPMVDEGAVEAVTALCRDGAIVDQLSGAASLPGRAAILEDSLHHDRDAWPPEAHAIPFRPRQNPERVRLTLPLPRDAYRRARAADTRWTRPPS
jgi:murein DD-endopeptidase MepM/ murein hydrolase activator NlpD